MINSTFVLAVWLASTALVLFLVVIALGGALQAGLAAIIGTIALGLAIAAFIVS